MLNVSAFWISKVTSVTESVVFSGTSIPRFM